VAPADETAIGYVPSTEGSNSALLEIAGVDLPGLLKVDAGEWTEQMGQVQAHFDSFGDKLPIEFGRQMAGLEARLEAYSA
jgi:phosphoenolpyruvate carboxykinase (GTP)